MKKKKSSFACTTHIRIYHYYNVYFVIYLYDINYNDIRYVSQNIPSRCDKIRILRNTIFIYIYLFCLQEQISFSILSDVCLPVSMLLLIVIWGYQLNAMTVGTDSGEDRTMLLVYGIGLIVISGSACVYIAIRMSVMKPEKIHAFLPGEVSHNC